MNFAEMLDGKYSSRSTEDLEKNPLNSTEFIENFD